MTATANDYSASIDIGYRRTQYDAKHRWFVKLPSVLDLLAAVKPKLVDDVSKMFQSGTYRAADVRLCEVPKPGFCHRPGAILSLRDAVSYASVSHALLSNIDSVLARTPDCDLANRRRASLTDRALFEDSFGSWKAFASRSTDLAKQASFVVVCDVAGFYENIDLQRLIADLKEAECDEHSVTLLQQMLYAWSSRFARGRGLPQGHSASDLLAKFYLSTFDRALQAAGIIHLRYNDDIRVFCTTKRAAEIALGQVIRELRKRGLILQSAKTEILPSRDAELEFNRAVSLVQAVRKRVIVEVARAISHPSMPVYAVQEALEDHPQIDSQAVHEAFRSYFQSPEKAFDKSLFHYLLNQLKRTQDAFALETVLDFLETRPDETEFILDYLAVLPDRKKFVRRIRAYLASSYDARPYQQHLILLWYREHFRSFSSQTLQHVRRFLLGNTYPPFLRDAAKEIVRLLGGPDEFDAVQTGYELDITDESKAMTMLALQRQHVDRRNIFYSQRSDQNYLIDAAIKVAREGKIPV